MAAKNRASPATRKAVEIRLAKRYLVLNLSLDPTFEGQHERRRPTTIAELVARFERNRPSYQAVVYNETQFRREFLDPFFEALGWDVDNERGHAEAYKDVIHEDTIKVGGAAKAPDYCFRIGGPADFDLVPKLCFCLGTRIAKLRFLSGTGVGERKEGRG